jgi:hypothetical protein
MDLDDVEFFLEWLEDRRRAEATAIRKASRGRGERSCRVRGNVASWRYVRASSRRSGPGA